MNTPAQCGVIKPPRTDIYSEAPQWAANNNVELCYTPTYSSWANPIEAHFGPLREFVLNNSDHPNHTVLTRRLHAHLRWRNTNARDPDLLAAQRRERARVRSQRGRRWGIPAAQPARNPTTHNTRANVC